MGKREMTMEEANKAIEDLFSDTVDFNQYTWETDYKNNDNVVEGYDFTERELKGE